MSLLCRHQVITWTSAGPMPRLPPPNARSSGPNVASAGKGQLLVGLIIGAGAALTAVWVLAGPTDSLTLLKKKLNYLHKKIAEKSTAEAADAGQDVKQDVKGGDAELAEDDDEKDLDVAEVLMLRREHFSPNLSLSFNPNPLCILKAKGAYLYTHDGRQILDCVNNVAHIGHSHPRLASVAAKQLSKVNTNTRYLCPKRVAYAQRLLNTFPEELDTVFFVNSGSEANDLALRLARAFTGNVDVLVLGAAYHGHTSSLIEVSPYKYEGKGGFAQRPHVHKVAAPDTYRGPHKGFHAGSLYAEEVRGVCKQLVAEGRAPAAFMAESILGCGGQLVLPQGYFQEAYEAVREAGGVCIADEVQVGFGRVGEYFWAFETQGVVPDIVTLGKPMGNGFPLGAVVTRKAIAEAFSNGMEYFNTFGGSNLSCAVGDAVLEVMEAEELQENARIVGNYTKELLTTLEGKYPCVGEVRGLGLFLGVEMVEDVDSKQPSERIASYVAARAIELNVQISTDGPFHNVLKIKPPMCFSKQDAKTLFHAIDKALKEYYQRGNEQATTQE